MVPWAHAGTGEGVCAAVEVTVCVAVAALVTVVVATVQGFSRTPQRRSAELSPARTN
jgi:hypothetical protein